MNTIDAILRMNKEGLKQQALSERISYIPDPSQYETQRGEEWDDYQKWLKEDYANMSPSDAVAVSAAQRSAIESGVFGEKWGRKEAEERLNWEKEFMGWENERIEKQHCDKR